ncbi:hypothetical protein WJX72_001698 [[Myrmecia] bisecta]|uniref:NADH:flavin oxidoreductase/NADH oxidase N-terminal domain-containing protein n=1 Tax=[Myrmecia] bisecta TaxID=41462 RepID=A0AAW1QPV7_9CHLO
MPSEPVTDASATCIAGTRAPQAARVKSMAPLNTPAPGSVDWLFQPMQIGRFMLKSRIVYAPLTRYRALNTVPGKEAALYYSQRTHEGALLISEATCISNRGHGHQHSPGIYTEEQIEAWKPVTRAVHDKGGIFFLQLWHVGRASHNAFQPNSDAPLSSSDIAIQGDIMTPEGPKPHPKPRALELAEIPGIIKQYVQAAKNALEAGFDGVEIHGAHGYLLAQFLMSSANKRTDRYGGSIENRARLVLEVTQAVVDAVGSDRTGIRLSPYTEFQDMWDPKAKELHLYLVKELAKLKLAYIHYTEPRGYELKEVEADKHLDVFRHAQGETPFLSTGSHNRETGIQAVDSGYADLVGYGRLFLANPDLPKRFKLNARLNPYNRKTFYIQDPVIGVGGHAAVHLAEA